MARKKTTRRSTKSTDTTKPTTQRQRRAKFKPDANPNAIANPRIVEVVNKIDAIKKWAGASVVGRADMIDDIILGVVSQCNVLALGVPGTAKTMLVRRIAESFCENDSDVFDVLLTKFSKPHEVFGATDIASLDQGIVKINTDGFLPSARVGVLDEVFKASSAILNSLLTIANERKFKNGSTWQDCPTRLLVGMSNEYPEDESLLAAFFDRFPIKRWVEYLGDQQFHGMIESITSPTANGSCPVKLTEADFDVIDKVIRKIEVPESVVEMLVRIRAKLRDEGVIVSDRRWVQAVRIMQANALLHLRKSVAPEDIRVLDRVLWNRHAQIPTVQAALASERSPFERSIKSLIDDAYSVRGSIIDRSNIEGRDSDRPNPDFEQAVLASSRAVSQIRNMQNAMEQCLENAGGADELGESDRLLYDQAMRSIDAIEGAISNICTGRDSAVQSLVRTRDMDVE